MVDHYFPQIPVKMESNRNSPIFRLRKSKVVEPSLRYVAVTKFGLLGSSLFPLTKSECFYSIESSEGNVTLGSYSEWSLTCYSSMQRPESRSSGGCSAGDGREIKRMNWNTTQGRSGETGEGQVYLKGGSPLTVCYESTRPYPQFQTGITVPNAPPFGDTLCSSVEPQSGNELLNSHSSPPPPVLRPDKLTPSEAPARRKRRRDNRNLLEDWKVPGSKKFKCKCCLKLLCDKKRLKRHILSFHSEKAKELGLSLANVFKCHLCGKCNSWRRNWRNHMRSKHPAELSTTHLEHESGNVETSHNLSSTSVELQSGNELLNSHSSPPPPVLLHDKLSTSATPARTKRHYHKRNVLEDWKVPGSKKFKCKCCLKLLCDKQKLNHHVITLHPNVAKELGLSGDEGSTCKICEKCYSSRMHWWNHMLRKHPAEAKAMCEKSTSFVDPDPCYEDWPVIPV